MPTSDISIRNARGVRVSRPKPVARVRSRRRGIAGRTARAGTGTAMDELLRALAKQELHATHELAIQPLRGTRHSLRVADADHSVDVDVRVDTLENAVILVELKFIARTAAGVALHLLERNVSEGLIVMQGDDPRTWSRVEKLADLRLPDEPLRIMLWIHGTFSSTVGGFGAITRSIPIFGTT
jgi:hypothetical protein